jgi:hypothetical protein
MNCNRRSSKLGVDGLEVDELGIDYVDGSAALWCEDLGLDGNCYKALRSGLRQQWEVSCS